MLKEYNYIAFDFETTGLDVEKDEAIQIGIVQFDSSGKIIDTYVSLIKPNKPIKELKGIVQYLTGFKLEDLEDAPTIDEVLPEISRFFDDKTIVIGHNIQFDVAILNKYLSFTPHIQIDTYPLSRQFFPHLPSYALDVIHSRLKTNEQLIPSSKENNAHDALYDSHMGYDIFIHALKKIHHLRRKYIVIDYCIQQSTGWIKHLLKRTDKPFKFSQKELFLPPLKSSSLNPKKVHNATPVHLPKVFKQEEGKPQYNEIDTSNSQLSEFLASMDWNKEKQWILATTHKSKNQIIQRYFDSMYISRNSFHDQLIFDNTRVNTFLHKGDFSDEEILFIIKYFIHFDAGNARMDINTKHEYMIFSALTHRKEKKRGSITLATHQQLREFESKIDKSDTVLFFDHDRWYQSYGNHLKKALDPYYLLNFCERIRYDYTLIGDQEKIDAINDFEKNYTIFLGILNTEINQYFVGYSENKRDLDFILDDVRFPKTKNVFPQMYTLAHEVSEIIQEEDSAELLQYMKQFKTYLGGLCSIEKKMYNGNKWWYVLHQRDLFIDYHEFLKSLPQANYHLLSSNKEREGWKLPQSKIQSKASIIDLLHLTKPHQIISHVKKLNTEEHLYCISSGKRNSQELFNQMIKNNLQEKYTIIAENITGGIGKNTFYALNSEKPVLCIGGYSCYLQLVAKKFAFSSIYLYHIFGQQKRQIVTDLLRYAR